MKRLRFLLIGLLIVSTCRAEEFFLKDAQGREYGPFEVRPGARIQVGAQQFEAVKITTSRDAVIQAMQRIVIPEVEFRQQSIQAVIAFLVKAGCENDPKKLGVNIAFVPPVGVPNAFDGAQAATNITITARNISLYSIVKMLRSVAGLKVCVDGTGVRFLSPGEPETEILHRWYPVERAKVFREPETNDQQLAERDFGLRRVFSEMGVEWPRGSSISYNASAGLLLVANTAGNLACLERLLCVLQCVPRQVEIEAQFVRFELTNLVRSTAGRVDDKTLHALWTNGCGRLLAAPRLITRSGSEASVRGVTEVLYPTVYVPCTAEGTNADATCRASCTPGPSDFATRETGAILTVLPEVQPDGGQVNLTLTPCFVEQPTWRDFGYEMPAGARTTRHVPAEQPFFHLYTYNTQLSLADGATALAGGGVPTADGMGLVYCFVTVRLLGIDGEPLRQPVKEDPVDLCDF